MTKIMKRNAGIMAAVGAGAIFLAACEAEPILFEGEERPPEEVADILGDRLEADNPGRDIDVTITEEVED